MPLGTIIEAKELDETGQPLLLAEFTFKSGKVLRVSTHPLTEQYGGYSFSGFTWDPRIMNEDLGPTQAMSDIGVDISPQASIVLADPDKAIYNSYEISEGFKGAVLRLYAIMQDVSAATGSFTSDTTPMVKFVGTCASPLWDDRSMTISATSLLNMTAMQMPPIRIQPLCSWMFPTNAADRLDGLTNGSSLFRECAYSVDVTAAVGLGNYQSGTMAFTSCNYTFNACVDRLGNASAFVPIEKDQRGNFTGHFGGYQYIPKQNSGLQRPYLTGKWEELVNATNEARYGDFVPMCYGTTWVEPLVMGIWGDGNYTHFEVMLCYGLVNQIFKVVVNGEEVPHFIGGGGDTDVGHRNGDNQIPSPSTTPEWKNNYWTTVNRGYRESTPNNFPGWGRKGDPYGSVACIHIQCLRQLAPESAIPKVQVLLEACPVRTYSTTTAFSDHDVQGSKNMAWILLDLLVWANWQYKDVNIQSFIDAAAKCDEQIYFDRMDGTYSNVYNESGTPQYRRFAGGFCVRQRVPIGELIRGVRNAMRAVLFFDYYTGKLTIAIKQTIASQSINPIDGSNYNTPVPSITVAGVDSFGYAAYSFDETNIIKTSDGRSTLNMYQKTNQDAPNKVTVMFQNRENEFSQDSATIVDVEDVARLREEVFGSFPLVGPQTYDYVRRITNSWFAENFRGNPRLDFEGSAIGDTGGTIVFELESTIKTVHLMVGQICLVTDQQAGLSLQPARVTKIQPSTNFETAKITLQYHSDTWYTDTFGQTEQPKYARRKSIVNRRPYSWRPDAEVPMSGDAYYGPTNHNFKVQPTYGATPDGSPLLNVVITGRVPVNSFAAATDRPMLELTGQGLTGGGYPTSATFYSSLCSMKGGATSTPLSATSNSVVVPLAAGETALQFKVLNWPEAPTGYVAFAGFNPFTMSFQDLSATANPSTVSLFNTYNEASWGAPDEAFQRFRWKIYKDVHAGVWGQELVSASISSLQISLDLAHGQAFTTNQWAGREISVLGISPIGTASFYVPIANFTVSGNDANHIFVSSGNPMTCVEGGNPLRVHDVVVMRYLPTFGQDANGYYFEDLLTINTLEPTGANVDEEIGRRAFVIAGTGIGTSAKIKSNTATRFYISGGWPVPPDATTRLVILEDAALADIPSSNISNAVARLMASYNLNMSNFGGNALFIMGCSESMNGMQSFEVYDKFREMWFFGVPNWVANETPTGTANGTNVTFDTAFPPAPATSLDLFLNGDLQKQGVDYTLLNNVITFTVAPFSDDIIVVSYRK